MLEKLGYQLGCLWRRLRGLGRVKATIVIFLILATLFFLLWKVPLIWVLPVLGIWTAIQLRIAWLHRWGLILILIAAIVVISFTGIPLGSNSYLDDGTWILEKHYFSIFNPKYIANKAIRGDPTCGFHNEPCRGIEVRVVSLLSNNLVAYGASKSSLLGQLFRLGGWLSSAERNIVGSYMVIYKWE